MTSLEHRTLPQNRRHLSLAVVHLANMILQVACLPKIWIHLALLLIKVLLGLRDFKVELVQALMILQPLNNVSIREPPEM